MDSMLRKLTSMNKFHNFLDKASWLIAIIAMGIILAVVFSPVYAGKVTWVNGKPVIAGPSNPVGCYNGGINVIVPPKCSKPDTNSSL